MDDFDFNIITFAVPILIWAAIISYLGEVFIKLLIKTEFDF